MNLQKDLREFLELLNSHKVDFVVVGAHAVAFHGYPRYTGDIDFLVRSTLDNAQRVVSVLTTFGFEDAAALTESLMQPEKVIQLGRPPNRIDLLTSISGVDFDEVWSTSVAGDIDGVPVRFIGREALLKNKRASGRLKDLADVEEMDSGHSR